MMRQSEIQLLSEAFGKLGVHFDTMIRPYLILYENYTWRVTAHNTKGLTGGFVIHAIPCPERISSDAWEEWYAFGEDVSHIILYASKNQSTQTVAIAAGDHNHPVAVQSRTWHYYRHDALQPLIGK